MIEEYIFFSDQTISALKQSNIFYLIELQHQRHDTLEKLIKLIFDTHKKCFIHGSLRVKNINVKKKMNVFLSEEKSETRDNFSKLIM